MVRSGALSGEASISSGCWGGEPSLGYTTRDGVDVFLYVPVLWHGYLDAAEYGADMDAGGLLGYVGLSEIDGNAADKRGEAAALEFFRDVAFGDSTEGGGGGDAVGVEVRCVGE